MRRSITNKKSRTFAFVGFCTFQNDLQIGFLVANMTLTYLTKKGLCKWLQIEAIVDKRQNCKINQKCETDTQNLWSIIPHPNVKH